MTEFLHDLPKIISLFTTLAMCGVTIGVGVAGACKLLKWAPVNITVNIYRTDETRSTNAE